MSDGTGPGERAFTVVVAVRRSGSPAALRWALSEAAAHGGTVFAVRSWRLPRPPAAVAGRPPLVSVDPDAAYTEAEQALVADVAAGVGTEAPVVCRLVHGGRRAVLIDASSRADLLVVDLPSRTDRTTPPRLVHRLIRDSHCPVVVLPPRAAG